jgi:hypothetical protein
MHRARVWLCCALVFWLFGVSDARAQPPEPETSPAIAAAEAALAPHFDGFFLDGDPGSPALLARLWAVAADTATAWLNSHPDSEKPAGAGWPDSELNLDAIRLDPQTWVISAQYDNASTVFIAAKREGRFQTVWTIVQAATRAQRTITAWAPRQAAISCKTRFRCGPLTANLGSLPDDASGRHRFLIDATYASPAGATVEGQLSIWAWDGMHAKNLLARNYSYMIDQAVGLRRDGDLLRVRTKDYFKTLIACGQCEGRQRDVTLRIGPNGIKDLGTVSVAPDLDLIDDLFERIEHGRPVAALAAPRVAAVLRRSFAELRKDLPDVSRDQYLGMIEDWTEKPAGAGKELCVKTDLISYQFDIGQRGGKPFIAAVMDLNGADCPPP